MSIEIIKNIIKRRIDETDEYLKERLYADMIGTAKQIELIDLLKEIELTFSNREYVYNGEIKITEETEDFVYEVSYDSVKIVVNSEDNTHTTLYKNGKWTGTINNDSLGVVLYAIWDAGGTDFVVDFCHSNHREYYLEILSGKVPGLTTD